MAWMLALALLVTLVGGSGTVFASGNALPGDALYPVKTTVENVRLALADDSENVDLYLLFTGSRVGELESLVGAGRAGDVPEAVDRFERQVDGAVDVLSRLAVEDAELARGLAVELDEGLSAYLVALTYLLDAAPQDARPAIEAAVDDLHDGHERLEALFPDDGAGDVDDDDGVLDDGPNDVDDSTLDNVDDDSDDGDADDGDTDVDDSRSGDVDDDSDDVDDDVDSDSDSGSNDDSDSDDVDDDVDSDSDSGSDDDSDSDSGSDDDSDSDSGSDDDSGSDSGSDDDSDSDGGFDDDSDSDDGSDDDSDSDDGSDDDSDSDDGSGDDGDSDGGSDDDHKDEDDERKEEDDERKDED